MNEKYIVTKLRFICALLLFASPCRGQNTTGKAETTGACSPAISGNENQVNISCQGISKDQAAKMTSILNKILANQISPDAVMAKLDEILKAVNTPIERIAKFTVMVPFETAPNAFPIPMDDNPDDPLFNTYTELSSLASNGTMPEATRETEGNGQITWNSRHVSMEEAPTFLGRLLQYYIFRNIDNLQRNSMTVYVGYPAEAHAGIEPPDAEVYPYEKLSSELGDNVFFRPFLHRRSIDDMTWKMTPSKFPKGTEIQFITQEADKYLVRFQRPAYFKADFIVQQFLGTGVGQVPKHFVSKNASTIMQWAFVVTMHYRIEHSLNSEFHPGNYAQWLDALYDGLHKKLEIDQSEMRSR